MNAPLDDLHVVEISGSLAGAYATRLFVLGGARVDLVETGASTLTVSQHEYLHQGARVRDAAAIEWAHVDVVVESCADGPLTPSSLEDLLPPEQSLNPAAVRLRITPFGSTGPYSAWKSSDLVDYSISGHTFLSGDPDRAPIPGPPGQPAIAAGLYGFIGSMAALFCPDSIDSTPSSVRPTPRVEVDHFAVMTALHQVTLLRWNLAHDMLARQGNRYSGAGHPNGPYQCRDGVVSIVGVTEPQVDMLLAVTGLTHLMDLEQITSSLDFYNHPELLDGPLAEWLADQDVDDVVELFQAVRVPACPLRTPAELLTDPQLLERGFFEQLGSHQPRLVPRAPFSVKHRQEPAGTSWCPHRQTSLDGATPPPLAGLRVLDMSRVWAGPLCGRILADLGAEVVSVEAPWSRGPREIPQSMLDATRYFPDDEAGERPWNRNGHIIKFSLGKKSLAVDLQHRDGVAAFERVVPNFHVLIENFSPRVMPQLGLGEDRLHELNPDLIYLTMPAYGRSGPAKNWLGYGSCIDSHAGLSALTGYSDASPWKSGVAWPDPLAGLHACSALLMQLWASQRGGGGCTIEAAQFEATVAAVGDQVLAAQSGDVFEPAGETGLYRCAGDDEWIAVTPDADDMVTLDLVDVASRRSATDLAAALQARGIAAAPVSTAETLMADPHLAATGAWVTVDQPDVGQFTTAATPLPGLTQHPGPAPTLGQHNAEVLTGAGLSPTKLANLSSTGIIANQPPR